MADKTGIEWTDATWNPTTGCDKVSPGCDNCYALTQAARLKLMGSPAYQVDGNPRTSGPGFGLQAHEDRLEIPRRWTRPRRIFVNSMSDLFHPQVSEHFIGAVTCTMARSPQHQFQVLTKRPKRMAEILNRVEHDLGDQLGPGQINFAGNHWFGAWPIPNVWWGTTIETNRYAFRAAWLREIDHAAIRFLSCEPLLDRLPDLDTTGIDWVIFGAESGAGARPMDPDWIREIIPMCRDTGTKVFVKQLSGGFHAVKDMDLFPEDLRIREYPA